MGDEILIISVLAIIIAIASLIIVWGIERVRYYTNHPIITPHFKIHLRKTKTWIDDIRELTTYEKINFIGLINDGDMDAKEILFSLKFYKKNKEIDEWEIFKAENRHIYSPTLSWRMPARKTVPGWSFSEYFDNPIYEFRTKCIWKIEALGLDNKRYCSCWAFRYKKMKKQIPDWTFWRPVYKPRFGKACLELENYIKCINCNYDEFGKCDADGNEYTQNEIIDVD